MIDVRPAVAADRPAIWALNAIPNVGATADATAPLDLPPVDGPPAAFPDLADVPDGFSGFFVAVDGGRIVGMAGYRRLPDDEDDHDRAEVLRVRVHPAMRRRGVGRLVMQAVEDAAAAEGVHTLILDTATNQPEAVAFYDALGYEQTGTETRPEWTWTLVWFRRELGQRRS